MSGLLHSSIYSPYAKLIGEQDRLNLVTLPEARLVLIEIQCLPLPCRWEKVEFVLDADSFRPADPTSNAKTSSSEDDQFSTNVFVSKDAAGNDELLSSEEVFEGQETSDSGREPLTGSSSAICNITLRDITAVKRCSDPSLPPGQAFWLGLSSRPEGHYFVAGESRRT